MAHYSMTQTKTNCEWLLYCLRNVDQLKYKQPRVDGYRALSFKKAMSKLFKSMGKPTMNKAYLWVELSTFYNTLIDATYQNMKANVNVIILKHEIPGMR